MALLDSQMLPTKTVPFGPAVGKAGWRHMHAVMGVQEGVCGATHMKASQRAAGGAGLFVDIAPGDAWVQGDDTARQGLYHEHNDAIVTLPTPANASGQPRFDQLILRVPDSSIAGATDLPVYEILQGTAQAGVTIDNRLGAASLPNGCMRIGEWVATNGYAALTDAMIRDRRPFHVCNFGRKVRTAGNIGVPAANAEVGAGTLAIRLECSGLPISLALLCQLATTAGANVLFSALIDGAQLDGIGDIAKYEVTGGAMSGRFKPEQDSTTVTPGSHLFTWLVRNSAGVGTATINANAGAPLVALVEETRAVRGNG